jgi:hypothetical protein
MKEQMKKLFSIKTLLTLTLVLAVFIGATSVFAEPWKFGVMSDTQWTVTKDGLPYDPAGTNPNGVAVSIIQQINRQFINHGVKFVIQVGDLTENGNDADIAARALAAQPLYDAGIGFLPMRGNHETYASPSNGYGIQAVQDDFPQTRGLSNTFGAKNFSSPTLAGPYPDDLKGMSYSFDYGQHGDNARFVILDTWVTPNKSTNPFAPSTSYLYGYSVADQQPWISSRLDKYTRGTEHAFVFSHQNLIGENHQDSIFTGYTDANPDMQNAFFASLQNNDVNYYISGHDHIHQRSIITSPNGAFKVQELICASNSSKFYTPKALNDAKWYGQKVRETSVSQERYTVGFYIFTVNGPCVTADYYSDVHGNWASDNCYPDGATPQSCSAAGSHVTPIFKFVKKETWGYCHNGKEFQVCQAGQMGCNSSYTQVVDSFNGTTAQILDGTNNSTAKDYTVRPFTKLVNIGWPDMDGKCEKYPFGKSDSDLDLASNIFTLSGMADLDTQQTDTYALSLSYDHHKWLHKKVGDGAFLLVTRDKKGRWVNAVDLNFGGTREFVLGPYVSGYELGTYGFDPDTRTAWAVINYNGDFAVARDIE